MPEYLSPGVYVEEVERGPKPIEGVSTSTAGFLGETERGETEPTLVTSFTEFQRKYGGFVENRFLSYAVDGFFRNEGQRAYIGRVTSETRTATGTPGDEARPRPGELRSSAAELEFGEVTRGHTATATVRLTNLGNPDVPDPDVVVDDANLGTTGEHAGEFAATISDDTLAPGETVEVTVEFTPGDTGDRRASLSVPHDGTDSPLTIPLRGEGVDPVASTLGAPARVDLGTVVLGHEATATVTVTNRGDPDVPDPDVTIDDANVATTGENAAEFVPTVPDDTVPPGESVDIEVAFAPDGLQTRVATLTIPHDGANSPLEVPLRGVGEEPHPGVLRATSASLDFGAVVVGHDATETVTLTNLGNPDDADPVVNIDAPNVEVTGSDAEEFTPTVGDATVDPGESVEIDVELLSRDELAKRGTLVVPHDGAGSPVTVALVGGGVVMEISAVGPGRWGRHVAVVVEDGTLFRPGENRLFKFTVRYWRDEEDFTVARRHGADTEVEAVPPPDEEEIFDDLSPDEASGDFYEKRINDVSNLIEVEQTAPGRPPNSGDGATWLDADFPAEMPPVLVRHFEGRDESGDEGEPGERTGLAGFAETDAISIVSVPDEHSYPNIPPDGVTNAVVDHCESMEDRIAILQKPQGPLQEEEPPVDSTYAAFYHPWIRVLDPATSQRRLVPPGGHVAGIYARTDSERGVHKAPANEIVRGATELEFPITKGDQDVLNPRGVNCIRSFRGRGIRVWGARTTSSDPLWKYVNVRRLFLYVEESIDENTQWVVFEPNNEQLWARVRQTISNFLTSVWHDGALMGTTPEEAFYVKCDRTTMTQSDIDNGRLIVEIGIAPVKPAEFVVFRISQWTGGAEGA